eukprot:scaffold166567_cov24-Tisochrysis_lutea.AAC.1
MSENSSKEKDSVLFSCYATFTRYEDNVFGKPINKSDCSIMATRCEWQACNKVMSNLFPAMVRKG